MVRDNNIRIRIFKNRLLYVLVCVLSVSYTHLTLPTIA